MAKITKKSVRTKRELLDSACELFSVNWYDTVSISNISKHAGKSNGAFYNYFKNKEEIFLTLLDNFLSILEHEMEKIEGQSLEERLNKFLTITIDTGRNNKKLVTLFREGQYRFNEMEKRLRDIYVKALSSVYMRELSETEYLFITGPLRFISIRSLYHNRPYDRETLKKIILNGLFSQSEFNPERVFSNIDLTVKREIGNTREILLEKAAELFGEEGYHQVNIYDITRSSKFAVGTFYRHFPSKESILGELVIQIGTEIRKLIRNNLTKDMNLLEQTIRGFYVFISHMEKHRGFYKIVREAEFVLEETVEEYYNNFEKGYLKSSFPESMDSVTVANALSGIGHYFGIEDIFSNNITDTVKSLKFLSIYLRSGISR